MSTRFIDCCGADSAYSAADSPGELAGILQRLRDKAVDCLSDDRALTQRMASLRELARLAASIPEGAPERFDREQAWIGCARDAEDRLEKMRRLTGICPGCFCRVQPNGSCNCPATA